MVGGDLETAPGFVLLPLKQAVVEPGPLRVARVKLVVGKLPRFGPPPRLRRKPSQRARPPAPLVLVSVGMQAGKGVGDGTPCAKEVGLGAENQQKMCGLLLARSLHTWANAIAVLVCDSAVWMHGHMNRVFLHSHGIIEVSLAV